MLAAQTFTYTSLILNRLTILRRMSQRCADADKQTHTAQHIAETPSSLIHQYVSASSRVASPRDANITHPYVHKHTHTPNTDTDANVTNSTSICKCVFTRGDRWSEPARGHSVDVVRTHVLHERITREILRLHWTINARAHDGIVPKSHVSFSSKRRKSAKVVSSRRRTRGKKGCLISGTSRLCCAALCT